MLKQDREEKAKELIEDKLKYIDDKVAACIKSLLLDGLKGKLGGISPTGAVLAAFSTTCCMLGAALRLDAQSVRETEDFGTEEEREEIVKSDLKKAAEIIMDSMDGHLPITFMETETEEKKPADRATEIETLLEVVNALKDMQDIGDLMKAKREATH